MPLFATLLLFIMMLFCPLVLEAEASLNFVTVQSQGSGQSYGAAVGSALTSAVTQVNGASIASTSMTSEVLAAFDTSSESEFMSSSVASQEITQSTKGVVREYRILEQSQEGPIWNVSIEATIVRYERSAQGDRLRLAVVPFRVRNVAFNQHRDGFVQGITSHLTQSRRFAILDREFEEERLSETDIYSSENTPVEEMAKLGNQLGTDYIIVGIIDDASSKSRTVTIESVGKSITTTQSRFLVSFRVIDAPTGQVKFSDSWSRTSEDLGVSGLSRIAADEISRQILDAIFPISVESIQGDILFLGQGGKSIRPGQKYRLIKLGNPIVDTYTGESLGYEEISVGMVQIIDVQPKISKGKLISTTIELDKEFSQTRFIVRLEDNRGAAGTHRPVQTPAKTEKKYQEKIKDLKESSEDLW